MSMTARQESDFLNMLKVFEETGALESVVVVGSWAEFLYEKSGFLKGFEYIGKTTDIDLFVRDLRKPCPPIDIVDEMCRHDFIYEEDYMSGCSRFRKGEVEVEFLICQNGDGLKKLPRTNIGVNAQQLTHMDMVSKNTVLVVYEGIEVPVPCPEVYVIQKMIINDRRKEKEVPDRQKVIRIVPYINIDKFNEIFSSLKGKEKAKVVSFVDSYVPDMEYDSNSNEFRLDMDLDLECPEPSV